jgi:hypothetical protein
MVAPASGSRRRWVGHRTRDGGAGCRGRPAGPRRLLPRREGPELGETLRTQVALARSLRVLRSADGSPGAHAHESVELMAIDAVAGGHGAGRDQDVKTHENVSGHRTGMSVETSTGMSVV